MKEIKLGTPEDMVEMLKEYLRKEMKAAEQWLGVHYTVFFFIAGIIAAYEGLPPDPLVYTIIPIYIISALHWIKTRKPKFSRNENGILRFTWNPIHGKRAVLNPIKRYKDIISNAHNGQMVITLIEAHKVQVNKAGKKETMTPETLGLIDKRTKEPNISWVYLRQSCEGKGIIDFNTQNAHYLRDSNKIAQQMLRFREALRKGLDIEIERGRDYHFDKGVFIWKTLTFRDEFTPFDIQRQREEVADRVRSRMQLHSLEEITRRGKFSNPEIVDKDELKKSKIDKVGVVVDEGTDEENDYDMAEKPTWEQ